MPVISTMELEHGIWRAKDASITARHAARIDAEAKNRRVLIPVQNLLIGVTALEFDYAVATADVRHFRMIPDLIVVPM